MLISRWSVCHSCIALFVSSLSLGLAINFARGERDPGDIVQDEHAYHRLAVDLLETGDYGTPDDHAGRSPAFPFVLAASYWVGGPQEASGRVAQNILSAVNVVLAFLLARFLAGNRAGWLAALFVQCDSYWWWMQFRLMTENLQAVFSTAALLLLLHAATSRGVRAFLETIGAGCLFALSQMAKPNMLPIPVVVVVLWPLLPRASKSQVFRRLAVFFVTTLVIWSPWWLRNYEVFHRFVPFTTGAGHVFYGAHFPGNAFRGEWDTKCDILQDETVRAQYERLTPVERELYRDREEWKAGLNEVKRRDVADLARHETYKFLRFWSPSTFFSGDTLTLRLLKYACIVLNGGVLAGFVFAMFQRRYEEWLCLCFVGSAMLTCLIFWGTIRLRYPLAPIICAYSAAFYSNVLHSSLTRGAATTNSAPPLA